MIDDRTYTDEQVTSACDFHVDNLRQLITWKAIVPAQKGGGRGRVRLWTMKDVQHISTISTLFNAGFSLKMAHTISYLIPAEHCFIELFDPMIFDFINTQCVGGRIDWFDAGASNVKPDAMDFYIYIVNRKYVVMGRLDDLFSFSELNKDHTIYRCSLDFANYFGPYQTKFTDKVKDKRFLTEKYAKWQALISDPFVDDTMILETLIDHKSLSWEYVPTISEDNAMDAFSRSITKLEINMTLGVRIAVRKVLGLPVDYP